MLLAPHPGPRYLSRTPLSQRLGCWLLSAHTCTSFLRLSLADGTPRPGDAPPTPDDSHTGMAWWRCITDPSPCLWVVLTLWYNLCFWAPGEITLRAFLKTHVYPALSPALSHLPHTPVDFSWERSFSKAHAQESSSESLLEGTWPKLERNLR